MKNSWLIPIILISFLVACDHQENVVEVAPEPEQTSTQIDQLTNEDPVITIKDTTIKKNQFDFYTLMNKISVELHRHADKEAFTGEELTNQMAYWDEQLLQYDNLNVNLQSVIELYAMALLGEEKGYYISEQELNQQLEDHQRQLLADSHVENLIAEFGKEASEENMSEYVRLNMLKDKVTADLRETVESETTDGDGSEQEINFLLHERYEELYIDQVKSLQMTIHVNE